MSPNQLLLLLKQNFNNNSNFYIFFAKEQTKPLLLYKNTVTEQHLMNIMEMRYITIVETNVMYDYCDIIITKIITKMFIFDIANNIFSFAENPIECFLKIFGSQLNFIVPTTISDNIEDDDFEKRLLITPIYNNVCQDSIPQCFEINNWLPIMRNPCYKGIYYYVNYNRNDPQYLKFAALIRYHFVTNIILDIDIYNLIYETSFIDLQLVFFRACNNILKW